MKKVYLMLTVLLCFTLAGCGNLSIGMAADPEPDRTPAVSPTPTEPFVYGKTSPCLADSGNCEENEDALYLVLPELT